MGEELDEMQFAANIIGTWQSLTTKKETPKMSQRSSWTQAFVKSDPRRNIVDFFKPGDHRGLTEAHSGCSMPSGRSPRGVRRASSRCGGRRRSTRSA